MSIEGRNGMDGMDPGDDDALWSLLGRQEPPVKASPYFARRVLREVGLDEQRGGGWTQRLRRSWTLLSWQTTVWSGALALGVLCLSAILIMPGRRPSAAVPPVAQAAVEPIEPSAPEELASSAEQNTDHLADASSVQDEEVIADLDNLLSREESRLWTEDTDSARF